MTTLQVPENSDDASRSLWTPSEVRYVSSWVAWSEGGRSAVKHEFLLSYMGEQETFGVLAEANESDALIEDMAAGLAERAMVQIRERKQRREDRLIPEQLSEVEHVKVRRELAAIWRDMRNQAWRKRDMTTGKLYFAGLH